MTPTLRHVLLVALSVVCAAVCVSAVYPGQQPFSVADNLPHSGCLSYCGNQYGPWPAAGCEGNSASQLCACAAGCACGGLQMDCSRWCVGANAVEYADVKRLNSDNSQQFSGYYGAADSFGLGSNTLTTTAQLTACIGGCANRGTCSGSVVSTGSCVGGSWPNDYFASISGCAVIDGNLTITASNATNLVFADLQTLNGFLLISGNADLQSVTFERLGSVTGGIRIADNPALTIVNASQLTTISGYLQYDNNTAITTFSSHMPALRTVSLGFSIENMAQNGLTGVRASNADFAALTLIGQLTLIGVRTGFVWNQPNCQITGLQVEANGVTVTLPAKSTTRRISILSVTATAGTFKLNGYADVYHAEAIALDLSNSFLDITNMVNIENVTNHVTLLGVRGGLGSSGVSFLSRLNELLILRVGGSGGGSDLTDLSPLCGITGVNLIAISSLPQLQSISGCFNGITTLKTVVLKDMASLTTVSWFGFLRTVTGDFHYDNLPLLSNHTGLQRLRTVTGRLYFDTPLFPASGSVIGSSVSANSQSNQIVSVGTLQFSALSTNVLQRVTQVTSVNRVVVPSGTANLNGLYAVRSVTGQALSPAILLGGPAVTNIAGLCRIPQWGANVTITVAPTYCEADVRAQLGPLMAPGTELKVNGADTSCHNFTACSCANITASGLANPCTHGTCVTSGDGTRFTCQCVPGYTGPYCDTWVNYCASNPCTNGGTCTQGINVYTCACPTGYGGNNCQTDINECASMPCQNGGNCTDHLGFFSCACPANTTTGPVCASAARNCASNPCRNGGSCTELYANGYTCSCPQGFAGPMCATDYDECASNPCQNGATCQNLAGRFHCLCPAGKNGVNCQTDYDACACNPCPTGQTCTTSVNGFICTAINAAPARLPAVASFVVALVAALLLAL